MTSAKINYGVAASRVKNCNKASKSTEAGGYAVKKSKYKENLSEKDTKSWLTSREDRPIPKVRVRDKNVKQTSKSAQSREYLADNLTHKEKYSGKDKRPRATSGKDDTVPRRRMDDQVKGTDSTSNGRMTVDKGCVEVVSLQKEIDIAELDEISKKDVAFDEVRIECNKLSKQVSTLENNVKTRKLVPEKEILLLSEMLMRQMLKLDRIEAEGERKEQRRQLVRRIQILVETMDDLKATNLKNLQNTEKTNANGQLRSKRGNSTVAQRKEKKQNSVARWKI